MSKISVNSVTANTIGKRRNDNPSYPFVLNLPCIDDIRLAEQQAFPDIVRPYANIRHLFFGHAHRPISGN